MKARLAIALVLFAFAASASAADMTEPHPLHWDCSRSGAPSLHETAVTYGYDNYVRVVPARDALRRQIRLACARGVPRVVVLEPNNEHYPRQRLATR